MNAGTAGHVGTPQLKQFLMVSIKKIPAWNTDRVISLIKPDGENESVHLVRANSNKPQAPSSKLQSHKRLEAVE